PHRSASSPPPLHDALPISDIDDWLERLAPHEPVSSYRHNVGEDNADAHLKRQLMAHQVVLAITDGKLDLGPWEQVFYAEFDGRRSEEHTSELQSPDHLVCR